MTHGQFYFVFENTPALPYLHDFYSATWTNGDPPRSIVTGPLQEAPRPWRNGALGGFVPPIPVGEYWQFDGGLKYPEDSDVLPLRFGVPLKCWTQAGVPFVPLDALSDPGSCCARLAWARVIELADLGDGATLTAFFAELLGPAATVSFFPEQGFFPAMCIVTSATFNMVFVGGTQTAQQFAAQAFTGFLGPIDAGHAITIVPWQTAATLLFQRLLDAGADPALPMFAAGYSYGGAVLAAFVQRVKNAFPERELSWMTFGMPKPSSEAGVDLLRQVPGVHVANHGDLICQLPISWNEAAWFMPLVGPVLALLWGKWHPMPTYLLTAEDGTKHFDGLPGLTADVVGPMVAKVMALQPLDPILPHRLREYVRRACLGCNCPKFPFTEAAWQKIFPLGCAPHVLGLQAPMAAGGALALTERFELPAPIGLGGVNTAAGSLGLDFKFPPPIALGLESIQQAAADKGLQLTTRLVRDDFLSLASVQPAFGALALRGGGRPCPCCPGGEAPTTYTVEIIASGYPFDGIQTQLTEFDIGPDDCYWDNSAEAVDLYMEISSQVFVGPPYLRCLWTYPDGGGGDFWCFEDGEDEVPETFTCSPWYFEFIREIYHNNTTPTGDFATVRVYSVP